MTSLELPLPSYRALFESLDKSDSIAIGCAAHVLAQYLAPADTQHRVTSSHSNSMNVLKEYAKVFPTIEFTFSIADLPEEAFIRTVHGIPSLRPVWHLTFTDIEQEKHYCTEAA